MGVTKKMY